MAKRVPKKPVPITIKELINKLQAHPNQDAFVRFSMDECYSCAADQDPFGSFDVGGLNYHITDVKNNKDSIELIYDEY